MLNLEDRLKYDWLFGLMFYGEKVSRKQLQGIIDQHSSAIQILKYANGIESILDMMTEEEWDSYGRDEIRVLLHVMGYMRNIIRMNGKTYYSIMHHGQLKKEVKEYISSYEEWLRENIIGTGFEKFNDMEFIMPEKI